MNSAQTEELFLYDGKLFPDYLRRGNAARFVAPFAKRFCIGRGLDVGCGKWPLEGATGIDLIDGNTAYDLPGEDWDYIFSSHCLEHLPDYVSALEHWKMKLRPGGVLFLYLPHPDMTYWRPENCRKHLHIFQPQTIHDALLSIGFANVIGSERDLAWSFATVCLKPE